jgi:hypothetical protein
MSHFDKQATSTCILSDFWCLGEMKSSHANVVEHFPFETVIHSYACSIQWLGLTGLARKPAASERQDEDSSAMDVNASCNHLPSSKSHSLVGASTLALGSPYFRSEIMVSGMSVYMHLPLHCSCPFAHLTFDGGFRLFGMPTFSYVLLFPPSPSPLPSLFISNTTI